MFGKILIRLGAGGTSISMGIYLFIETFNQVPAMYVFTSIFGLLALVAGCFLVVWDEWL
tara:strand:+ start:449 stop:625 length:177 start_codon:yes stop_codon:yes gene_type:complete